MRAGEGVRVQESARTRKRESKREREGESKGDNAKLRKAAHIFHSAHKNRKLHQIFKFDSEWI